MSADQKLRNTIAMMQGQIAELREENARYRKDNDLLRSENCDLNGAVFSASNEKAELLKSGRGVVGQLCEEIRLIKLQCRSALAELDDYLVHQNRHPKLDAAAEYIRCALDSPHS